MNRNLLVVLTVAVLLLIGAVLLYAANATLRIDDKGSVIAPDQHRHAKVKDTITWVRQSGAAKSWFVNFPKSPCAEGAQFGSDRGKTCTINVTCPAKGDPACTFPYQSSTGPTAAQNDPDIIVDP